MQGTEIIAPTLNFSLRAKLNNAKIGLKYARTVASLTGSVNAIPFPPTSMDFVDAQFDRGEVVFRGGIGSRTKTLSPQGSTQEQTNEVELFFTAAPNRDAGFYEFNSAMKNEGHDFIWYEYSPLEDPFTGRLSLEAKTSFVQRVYEKVDLRPLLVI